MFQRIRMLLELIRFSHTVFALPFALLSAVLAWKQKSIGFQWLDLVGIVLCMVFARSAAMAFNRLADRRIDALNPRTARRQLPAGLLSTTSVAFFTVLCAACFVGSTAIFLWDDNRWPLWFATPVLLFILAYSFTKRFTVLSHFWLGASLMLAPLAAWIAILGIPSLSSLLVPVLLGLAVFFWVSGFDIIYACQDAAFDRRSQLKSIPARLGVGASLKLAFVLHLGMIALLIALFAASRDLGWIYLAGVGAATILLCYEHWLVRPNDLSRVNEAFLYINGLISIWLFLIVWLQVTLAD